MDKMMPQAVDIEEALIAAILVNPQVLDDIINIVRSEMFYDDGTQIIFEHIIKLFNDGKHPDIITIKDALTKSDKLGRAGGVVYLTDITDKIVTDKYAVQHAKIIKEKYLRRQFIRISDELQRLSYNEHEAAMDEVINFAESSLLQITEDTIKSEPEQLNTINKDTVQYIEKLSRQEVKLIGVPSGITQLDRVTLGFQDSDLILIAARPSMGKTAFSLSVARDAARQGYKVLFFSLEMSRRQLSFRMLVDRFTDISELKTGRDVDWDKLNSLATEDYTNNLFIDDSPSLRTMEIRSIARKMKRKFGIDMIIVDYLQLVQGDKDLKQNGSRYFGDISRRFKSLAKELNIPVIALSQLNRKVEDRGNPFPILSDLRESGELEQDADIVIFLTRFIRLDKKHWTDKEGDDMRDKAYIDVAKNRNGKTEKILITASEDAMFWGY